MRFQSGAGAASFRNGSARRCNAGDTPIPQERDMNRKYLTLDRLQQVPGPDASEWPTLDEGFDEPGLDEHWMNGLELSLQDIYDDLTPATLLREGRWATRDDEGDTGLDDPDAYALSEAYFELRRNAPRLH